MGNAFVEPVTAKETDKVKSGKFVCGSSCMQGWRPTMEDAHIHILSHDKFPEYSFFALFDGHGGSEVANFVSEKIVQIFFSQESFKIDIPRALRDTFLEMDKQVRESLVANGVGATGNVVIIKGKQMICANIGDSRTVVSIGGFAQDLSEDHKPHGDKELERIINAGGFVTNFRINGSLALSRAFGDYQYKANDQLSPLKQMVTEWIRVLPVSNDFFPLPTALPDITEIEINPNFEFFVVACDGIWDVMTSQEVVNFVRLRIACNMPPEVICEELMTNCLAPDARMGGLGCDNMTVVIVCFIEGRDMKALREACSNPVLYNLQTSAQFNIKFKPDSLKKL